MRCDVVDCLIDDVKTSSAFWVAFSSSLVYHRVTYEDNISPPDFFLFLIALFYKWVLVFDRTCA